MNLIQSTLRKSPALAKEPMDMKPYGLLDNRYDRLPTGHSKFVSEDEANNSREDYKFFDYYINDIGFRDPYPQQKEENVIGFFGCSMTFGQGVDSKDNFPYLLSERYGMQCLNLGMFGSSAKRVALTFSAAARIWKMKLAVITLPAWTRALYVDNRGDFKNIHATADIKDVEQRIYMNFLNDNYLMHETREAIEQIDMVSKMLDVPIILTSWDMMTHTLASEIAKKNPPIYKLRKLDEPYHPDDYARDNAHPGTRIINRYVKELTSYIDSEKILTKE